MSAKIFNSPAMMAVFERIAQERCRQEGLARAGKFSSTCASKIMDDNRKLRVLVEEVGEVAQEIDFLENAKGALSRAKFSGQLREELTQVAAVAVAWLESLEGK
jgi:hypothetical protein